MPDDRSHVSNPHRRAVRQRRLRRQDDGLGRSLRRVAADPQSDGELTDDASAAARLEPLDVDGVQTVAVGTAAWLVALIGLLPFYRTLQDQGRLWWLWTCAAGIALGLFTLWYCRRRRRLLGSRPTTTVDTSALGAAEL
jgi:Protein of unknown function (DUF2530)